MGYTKVPARWIFQNKAIAFNNAIVLSMEMDQNGIDTAPSIACETTVMEIYRDLGQIANKIAVFFYGKAIQQSAFYEIHVKILIKLKGAIVIYFISIHSAIRNADSAVPEGGIQFSPGAAGDQRNAQVRGVSLAV